MKRLLYIPGLISLTGLLIALPLFYKKNLLVKEYCLPLIIPRDGDDKFLVAFSKYNMEREVGKRKKINFILDDNKEENIKKMDVIRNEALKLKYTLDTSTVILLTLSDSISYGEFVSLVDMCEADGHKRHASWDNKFVIFGEWPKIKKQPIDTIQLFSCGYRALKKPVRQPGFFELINKKINSFYTPQGSYLLLGWIVLFVSFILFKKKRSILQK